MARLRVTTGNFWGTRSLGYTVPAALSVFILMKAEPETTSFGGQISGVTVFVVSVVVWIVCTACVYIGDGWVYPNYWSWVYGLVAGLVALGLVWIFTHQEPGHFWLYGSLFAPIAIALGANVLSALTVKLPQQ